MDDRRNYYRVLHLQPDAPIGLVRVNYRTLMQKLSAHPDLGGENWSAAHLNAAYRTLSDPKARAAYDRELLSRYDIQVIAEGRAKPRARRSSRTPNDGANRRNYYRVLQTQRDAPLAIIEASHQALRASHPDQQALLDEALALLSDPELRATYDRLIEAYDHQEALARIRLDRARAGVGDYEPTIRCYCAFCKRPHMKLDDGDPETRCDECESPLFPPPRQLLALARRAVARVRRSDPVTLFFDWPSRGLAGQVIDLSPTGMRCETTAALDLNDVIKVTSDAFQAVGSVAHGTRERTPEAIKINAGLRFLAVRFATTLGNFRSLKV